MRNGRRCHQEVAPGVPAECWGKICAAIILVRFGRFCYSILMLSFGLLQDFFSFKTISIDLSYPDYICFCTSPIYIDNYFLMPDTNLMSDWDQTFFWFRHSMWQLRYYHHQGDRTSIATTLPLLPAEAARWCSCISLVFASSSSAFHSTKLRTTKTKVSPE